MSAPDTSLRASSAFQPILNCQSVCLCRGLLSTTVESPSVHTQGSSRSAGNNIPWEQPSTSARGIRYPIAPVLSPLMEAFRGEYLTELSHRTELCLSAVMAGIIMYPLLTAFLPCVTFLLVSFPNQLPVLKSLLLGELKLRQ